MTIRSSDRPAPLVVLLRGINVGGHNRLPMAELRQLLTDLGLEEVSTYVQSGNAFVRDPTGRDTTLLEQRVAERLEESFGLTVPVMVRTAEEISTLSERNPFLGQNVDDKLLHVVFLSDEPTAAAIDTLDPHRSPGDRFIVDGRELFVAYGRGAAGTKLTVDYLERCLGVRTTARNWKTVGQLQARVSGGV